MLSWKGFQVSTKLSYAIYLTQFPVFFFNVGRRRHIHHYYNFVSIIVSTSYIFLRDKYLILLTSISLQLDTNEFICIFLASVALTIFFDAPFQNIKKLIFKRAPMPTKTPTPIKISDSKPQLVEANSSSESNPVSSGMTPNRKVVHAHSD